MNHQPKPHRRIKDLNPKAVTPTFLVAVAFIIAVFYGCAALMGCQKESSFTSVRKQRTIESDHDLRPKEGFSLYTRPANYAEELAKGQGKGKGGPKPKPVTDTTTNPPTNPPTTVSGAVLFLDFDGQYLVGTAWNGGAAINCRPSNMTPDEQAQILSRVQGDYAGFAVTVTTDSAVYLAATKRQRVIITESYEWYGMAGGVAYVNSFGYEEPCFVFNSLLSYNVKYVADAISHEAGHTLGNHHQSRWENGTKVEEYNTTIAADGKGYLMGYPYDKVSGWQTGLNTYGNTQDDRLMINATLTK